MTNLEKALAFSLKWEGKYVNDPDDPGGETNYGISKRAHPNEDIKNLTLERVTKIYEEEYWNPAGCGGLELPLAVCVFDSAVNHGVDRALEWLEETHDPLVYTAVRRNFYYMLAKNPKRKKYLKGWLNRVIDLRKYVEILQKEKAP